MRCGGAFSADLIDERPGVLVAQIAGPGAREAFAHEAGGHRWQRVPPTERHGRRHTSTITVAVLPVPNDRELEADALWREVEWQATRGSGKGGQARNKTSNAVIMKHKPTGMQVRVESERSQAQNKMAAFALMRARLNAGYVGRMKDERDEARRTQVGTGQRGDKIRTVSTQNDRVTHHATGRSMSVERYRKGFIEELWA